MKINKISKSTCLKKFKSVRRSGTIKKKEKVEKISLDDFDFYQKLSKINNCVLRLCQKIENGHYFCMRVLKKVELLESKIIEHLYNEYKIILKIYHPFIIQLKGINTKDPKGLYFLFEFVQGGELLNIFMLHHL